MGVKRGQGTLGPVLSETGQGRGAKVVKTLQGQDLA